MAINNVRKLFVSAKTDFVARSYSVDKNGSPIDANDTVSKVLLLEEFGQQRERELPTSIVTIGTAIAGGNYSGSQAYPSSGGVWNSSIDGKQGYNITANVNGTNLTFENGVASEPLTIGFYKLTIEFSNGTAQEFAISVRD